MGGTLIGQDWAKSSFSNGSGGSNCVELCWRKAEACLADNCVEVSMSCSAGSCVEVSVSDEADVNGFRAASRCATSTCVEVSDTVGGENEEGNRIYVRDSKQNGMGDQPVLAFTRAEWAAFLAGAKAGEFDLPEPVAAGGMGELADG
jgi:hypothetical protein